MNREAIEARLRTPHPLEKEFAAPSRYRGRVRVLGQGGGGSFYLLPIALILVVVVAIVRLSSSPEGGNLPPGSSASTAGPQATKTFFSVPPETIAPPVGVGPCVPGSVNATLAGWGGAGGTQFALIKLTATGASCSVPSTPGVSINSGGTVLGEKPASETARVALSAPLDARVGISSLCPVTPGAKLTVVLDLSGGLTVSVPLPSGFPAVCQGATSVFVDDLFPTPASN